MQNDFFFKSTTIKNREEEGKGENEREKRRKGERDVEGDRVKSYKFYYDEGTHSKA